MALCKYCKGTGVLHPTTTVECPICKNAIDAKRGCKKCKDTGLIKVVLDEECIICKGTGSIIVKKLNVEDD